MQGTAETQEMLSRLEADNCLPKGIIDTFFNALLAEINAHSMSVPAAATDLTEWAKRRVLDVLAQAKGSLQCQGSPVPAGIFENLARVRPARDYAWCLPSSSSEDFLEEFPADSWPKASDDDLRSWIEPHIANYNGAFETGNKRGLVWVTDASVVPDPSPPFAFLKDMLGLVYDPDENIGLLCRYRRADVLSLHLPRSLDGIDHPPFRLVEDCAAHHGMTLQLSANIPGWPEAVHSGCQIPAGASSKIQLVA